MERQRSPLTEVKANIAPKTRLIKAPSRLPLSGSRLKRGPEQMETALEPAKKRTRGLGPAPKMDTLRPRAPALGTVSQSQGQTAAQRFPRKTGPCPPATALKNQRPVPTVPAQKPAASTAPPVVAAKKPSKRPGWDLKGQLCDLNAELKRCREKVQTLGQENQQLRDQLRESQQQASALGVERHSLEGELARVQAQAEQDQQELGSLRARVLQLEEQLGTQEVLVHVLQKEQLELQEERKTLTSRLEQQERRLQASEAALSSSQAEVASLRQETTAQAALLTERGDRLHGLEMERRRLHNQLQELKGNIRVFCRVRPVLAGEPNPSPGFLLFPPGPGGPSDVPTRLSLSRSDDRRGTLTGAPAPPSRHDFSFDRVFPPESRQEEVFEEIAMLVQSALDGYPVCIFAYGQTGSGKTFTITGGAERYSDRGIIPRTLSYIFEQLQKDSSKIYTTHISYLEIYNECGYDLLDPRHEASRLEDLPKVTILEDPDQNIHLKNLSLHQATTEEEALNLLFLGDTNRMIAETPMNQASTRSHCIFTVHLSSKEPGSATIRHAKLHLVDLAGSERVAKTGVGGQLLTEAKYINLSLHYLEQVIIALSEKNRSHIPYRNSMMTSVLRDSLGGNCMTTMIATLSLEKRNIEESISTCRFAQRVALIKNEAVLNEEIDPRLMIIRLQKEVQELKDELAIVSGEQRTEALTEEELLQLEKLITSFLEDQDPESRLEVGADMRKIHHCFHHLKKLLNDKRILGKSAGPSETENQDCQEPLKEEESRKLQEILKQRDSEINILVNMLKKEKKKTQDYLSSMDRREMRSSQGSPFPSGNPQEGQRMSMSSVPAQAQDFGTSGYRSSSLRKKTGMREEMSLGRQEAFEIFKRDHADSVTINDNKQILKQRFSEAKALGESINEARRKIGRLKDAITQRHMQQVALGISDNTAAPPGPDRQEEQLRLQLEEEKRRYKTMFTRLKALKVEIEHLQLLMDKAKVKLQKEFEAWWAAEATSLQVHSPAMNPLGPAKTSPQAAEPQQDWSQLLANRGDVNGRNVPPTPCPSPAGQEKLSPDAQLEASIPERPMSVPLTGDSRTDSDILAFIRARQSLLQKKCLGSN
ncbi:PREDICTED: kinesin-like protein KIF6 isoform X2 [Chinchilla lanigera]|uniref:kinesin-like protein KIF6 isoform X2 n=1 Tax=Chinchilla lanigera TaxID=34839 RepID=UPI000698EC57|nr:PREDICTED: kinesin-like protein KIF6 isoform X2 [Chinchilla lanigera]